MVKYTFDLHFLLPGLVCVAIANFLNKTDIHGCPTAKIELKKKFCEELNDDYYLSHYSDYIMKISGQNKLIINRSSGLLL